MTAWVLVPRWIQFHTYPLEKSDPGLWGSLFPVLGDAAVLDYILHACGSPCAPFCVWILGPRARETNTVAQTKAIPWPFPVLNLLGSSLLLPPVSLHPSPGHIHVFESSQLKGSYVGALRIHYHKSIFTARDSPEWDPHTPSWGYDKPANTGASYEVQTDE